jgi:hypothetical protein
MSETSLDPDLLDSGELELELDLECETWDWARAAGVAAQELRDSLFRNLRAAD